jgi:hypothetical protein
MVGIRSIDLSDQNPVDWTAVLCSPSAELVEGQTLIGAGSGNSRSSLRHSADLHQIASLLRFAQ